MFGNILRSMMAIVVMAGMAEGQAAPVGTAFIYQGMLKQGAIPANGIYDLSFDLFFAAEGGASFGTNEMDDVTVVDGIFTVTLDFGVGYIVGDALWLQIGVRPGASQPADPYTTLAPRQKLMPTPYAINMAVPVNITTATTDTMISLSQLGSGRGIFVLQDGANIGIQSAITNNTNTNAAILASTNGSGSALQALSSGFGAAIKAENTSSGYAGSFVISNESSSSDALIAFTDGTASAVNGVTTGNGEGVRGYAAGDGVGVYGLTTSDNGIGVKAVGSGVNGTALEILDGAIKVTDAGQNSSTPVFIHVATEPNSDPCDLSGCFCYETVIDNQFCNNKPDAILIVTVNGESGNSGQGDPVLERVEYDSEAGRWIIRAKFDDYFCHGQKFNVLVVNP